MRRLAVACACQPRGGATDAVFPSSAGSLRSDRLEWTCVSWSAAFCPPHVGGPRTFACHRGRQPAVAAARERAKVYAVSKPG
jgi:hypothetical protein